MQRRRLVELYDDLSIRLPSVVGDEVFQVLGERLAVQLVLSGDVLVVGRAEQQRVAVSRQHRAVAEALQRLLGLALQAVLDLLRSNLTTENARKAVVDGPLELALESLQDSHRRPPFAAMVACRRASDLD